MGMQLRCSAIVCRAALLAIALVCPSLAASSPAPMTRGLHVALDRIDAEPTTADRLPVWVYFSPRTFTPGEREAARREAEARLSAAAIARRARVTTERILEGDLPLDARHVAGVRATGASLRTESRWLNAVTVDATPAQITALAELPFVKRLGLVARLDVPAPVPLRSSTPRRTSSSGRTWSIDYGLSLTTMELMNVPPVHDLGFTGAGVIIGMLDTGFRTTHSGLDHLPILGTRDEIGDDSIVDYEPGDAIGTHEHGTWSLSTIGAHAPGLVVGPAFGASYYLVRAEDPSVGNGNAEEGAWIAGLEWAEAQGADIVTSSLGAWSDYTREELDGDTAPMTIAADLAAGRGLVIFNSAGNQGQTDYNVIVSPADGDSVIAVGGTDADGVFSPLFSSGPAGDGRIKPDVTAQALNVNVADPNDDFGHEAVGGTSFSAPFVAGVGALILERAPFLTPIQVREALRRTADHADAPDNDYGWGVVDALAAVFYWGPNFTHVPLPNTEDTLTDYAIEATLDDQFTVTPASVFLYHRVDGGAWQQSALVSTGDDEYTGSIPGQPEGTSVDYYLEATDDQGLVGRFPLTAPASPATFRVEVDVVPPVLTHTALRDQPLASWPPAITARVTDEFGVASVAVDWSVNGSALSGSTPLVHGLDDIWGAPLPIDPAALSAGDVIEYSIRATDTSLAQNAATAGPHTFAVVSGAGNVLVIDVGSGGEQASVASWLMDAGYTVASKTPANLVDADFEAIQAVVLLTGANPSPLSASNLRPRIFGWVNGGGRILVEGGEIGFQASASYANFFSNVLHAGAWYGDLCGDLIASQSDAILDTPLTIATPIVLSGSTETEQDCIVASSEARSVLVNSDLETAAGVLVYDDSPTDPGAQVVYMAFALSAVVDPNQAEALVVNAMARLIDSSVPTSADPGTGRPSSGRLRVTARPNPFNAHTVVHFETPEAANARIDVFDARGVLVRRLLGEGRYVDAGPHDVVWDGRDDQGTEAHSGIYYVRTAAGGESSTAKVALVK